MKVTRKSTSAGFAVVETLLVVVIVALVAGVGAYVLKQKHNADKTLAVTSSSTKAPAANGTSASIDQLTENDAQTEANVDKSADSQAQNDAASSNSAQANIGGAYNESNL